LAWPWGRAGHIKSENSLQWRAYKVKSKQKSGKKCLQCKQRPNFLTILLQSKNYCCSIIFICKHRCFVMAQSTLNIKTFKLKMGKRHEWTFRKKVQMNSTLMKMFNCTRSQKFKIKQWYSPYLFIYFCSTRGWTQVVYHLSHSVGPLFGSHIGYINIYPIYIYIYVNMYILYINIYLHIIYTYIYTYIHILYINIYM
jgi:hypothetical protein